MSCWSFKLSTGRMCNVSRGSAVDCTAMWHRFNTLLVAAGLLSAVSVVGVFSSSVHPSLGKYHPSQISAFSHSVQLQLWCRVWARVLRLIGAQAYPPCHYPVHKLT